MRSRYTSRTNVVFIGLKMSYLQSAMLLCALGLLFKMDVVSNHKSLFYCQLNLMNLHSQQLHENYQH